MSRTVPSWLDDPVAIVVGEGEGIEAIAHELAAAGATIARGGYAGSLDEAGAAIDAAASAARDPVTLLVHGEPDAIKAPPETLSPEAWRSEMGARLDSRFFYASALATRLFKIETRGAILFLAHPSSAVDAGLTAAGGGMRNLVQTLGVEWARDRIRTNAIESHYLDGGTAAELRSLGALSAYLLSDYAAYVTGSVMGVDIQDV